jgi:hypothetical protein
MEWLVVILLNLASNGLTEMALFGGREIHARRRKQGEPKPVSDALKEAISEAVRQVVAKANVPPERKGQLEKFLESSDVQATVRQIYAVRLTSNGGTGSSDIKAIRERFAAAIDLYAGNTIGIAAASNLFDLLLARCDAALQHAIEQGILAAHEARSVARHRVVVDELHSIRRSLEFLTEAKPDIPKILQFEDQYRKQVGNRHSFIRPPNLDQARKLPIDKIYVAPNFAGPLTRKKQDFVRVSGLQQFLSGVHRTVLLGQPGGGKSTLTHKVCSDLSERYDERLLADRLLSPVLVILRDYAVAKARNSLSILQFIEETAQATYQVPPPKDAFEYLLNNGGLLVIFDGLDELLDTGRRREMSDDVESFSTQFPSTPILVTSREIGYDQAPLDEERFQQFRLAAFREDEVVEYAQKWFAADVDLPERQRADRAAAFVRDSALVADLRTNPLMLALMCSIYRGESYIPRNRPDVYEKCALMLFEQWDRSRSIRVSLAIEYHLFPAMQFLAHWIYSSASLQGGVTEQKLVQRAVDFLVPRRFDDRAEAEVAAREFIAFCRGRAWVFTDTGTTPDGERLYQFTHRTFLEYFTANHLVHTSESSAALLKELRPKILREEWDVVAQLAFQIMSKTRDRASDELLGGLLKVTQTGQRVRRVNALSFAARCLEFLVPSPRVTRSVTSAVWEETMRFAAELEKGAVAWPYPYGFRQVKGTVGDLFGAARENRDPIRSVVTEAMVKTVKASARKESGVAARVTLELDEFTAIRGSPMSSLDAEQFARTIAQNVISQTWDEFKERGKADWSVAFELVMRGFIDIDQYLEWHRFSTLFQRRDALLSPGWPSIAEYFMAIWALQPTAKPTGPELFEPTLASLGDVLLREPPPWPRATQLAAAMRNFLWWRDITAKSLGESPEPRATFAAFALFAAAAEAYDSSKVKGPPVFELAANPTPRFQLIAPLIRARFTDVTDVEQCIANLGFDEGQTNFARAWIRGDLTLVKRLKPRAGSRGRSAPGAGPRLSRPAQRPSAAALRRNTPDE